MSTDESAALFYEWIKQYYHVLHKIPEMRAKFYKENSSWTMRDGGVEVNAQGQRDIGKAFATCPLNGARVDFGASSQLTFNEVFNVDENGNKTKKKDEAYL